MSRLIRISHYLLPLLVAGAAAGFRLQVGETGPGLVLMMLGGALLGGGVALMLESVAIMLGLLREESGIGQRRRDELLRQKDMLLRSIKDIELDVALQKLDEEQAKQATESLRQQALDVLRHLDEARLQARTGIEEQIERELAARLAGSDKSAGEAAR